MTLSSLTTDKGNMSLPKPYYQDDWVRYYCSDALTVLSGLEGDSIDLLCTDPPYGISFMGKAWDKALPDINIWKECLRVLKPGAFAFVMSIPRSDCLSRMIISLEDAGFRVDFTPIYWTYASGFPKAQNIGKAVDKRAGVYKEGELLPSSRVVVNENNFTSFSRKTAANPQSPQAKALDGSYGGFQPKPAVEVIIVAMKPLSEKTFVAQALKNRKGITWLDSVRIPYESEGDKSSAEFHKGMAEHVPGDFTQVTGYRVPPPPNPSGRFPANLLVSDDVLNDGSVTKSGKDVNPTTKGNDTAFFGSGSKYYNQETNYGDSGSFSRYFDLDKWAKTFPFLIVAKASKSEKNKGCEDLLETAMFGDYREGSKMGWANADSPNRRGRINERTNSHPTVKPLKLMSYLITLGSRSGDTVLDPFMGSGTTPLAAKELNRKCIGIEIEEKYCEIATKRCSQSVMELKI